MKRKHKWLLAGGILWYTYKKLQSIEHSISLESQIVADVLPFIPILPDPKNEKEYNYYKAKSKAGYALPKSIEKLYSFTYFDAFNDTLELIPSNSWQNLTIFYIHGGAYWSEPTFFHYKTLAALATKTNARIIMPIYPKAPFYTSQDVLEMVTERYLYLLEKEKCDPNSIVLMGDSAGGGCALALLQILKNKNYRLPRQVILLSPWLDVTDTNEEMKKIQPFDKMLNIEKLRYLGSVYAGDLSVNDPLVSPINGDFSNCPPITVFSGTHDILFADCKKFASIATKRGWQVTLYAYKNMPHDFSLLPTPEGKESLEKIVAHILT